MDKPFKLSVKAILTRDDGKCLIVQRSAACKSNASLWDFPGGKVDPGEEFHAALLREIREETGFEATPIAVLGHAESEAPNCKVAYLFMRCVVTGGAFTLSPEHDGHDWVDLSELSGVEFCPQFSDLAMRLSSGVP